MTALQQNKSVETNRRPACPFIAGRQLLPRSLQWIGRDWSARTDAAWNERVRARSVHSIRC
jgi:hypothetical protein